MYRVGCRGGSTLEEGPGGFISRTQKKDTKLRLDQTGHHLRHDNDPVQQRTIRLAYELPTNVSFHISTWAWFPRTHQSR